ncbi:hypothetical protein Q5H92_13575 [Hymenobacter sp. M29]|uniref:Uncharacterized protein n=1 Tax=Hymenobacter mellowenesis TaxID=3063995 RepID=A0ABT9AC21_9BACT|nr:hypothetical protein [Hymenobacter sp. M29]MDO7847394.1 hypothetical protein [Hymenobacter sp. M29]
MRLIQVVLAAVFCSLSARGQDSGLFKIEVVTAKHSDRKSVRDFKRASPAFYEDESFTVTKSCAGEFGGSLIFKEKATGLLYGCEATCPVILNKLNGQYIATTTLSHMIGFSKILAIDNPRALPILKPSGKQRGAALMPPPSSREPGHGVKTLVDTIHVLALGSFPYQGQLYHVVTDFKKTFLAKVSRGKFVTIAPIADFSIRTSDPEMVRTDNGHYVLFYRNREENGYLDVHENAITVFRY